MIRKIESRDAEAMAALHQRTLRSHMRGRTGLRLLACRYVALATDCGGTGFVFVEDSGRIGGFICGVWDARLLRFELLRLCGWSLALWGGVHAFFHPVIALRALGRLASSVAKWREPDAMGSGYELRPVAVDPAFQRQGVAGSLLRRLLDDASGRKFPFVVLRTEVDNANANAFYAKHGFTVERTSSGYNYYRYILT
jgi:ribosomal protein S18 acetylase RimI-like enzyme